MGVWRSWQQLARATVAMLERDAAARLKFHTAQEAEHRRAEKRAALAQQDLAAARAGRIRAFVDASITLTRLEEAREQLDDDTTEDNS